VQVTRSVVVHDLWTECREALDLLMEDLPLADVPSWILDTVIDG
jgi:hypothetical protein